MDHNIFDRVNNFAPAGKSYISQGTGASMARQLGNPDAKAQIDLDVKLVFGLASIVNDVDNIATVNNMISSATLPQGLKTKLPVFFFGNSDFAGGYSKVSRLFNTDGWTFIGAKIVTSENDGIELNSQFLTGAAQSYTFPSVALTQNVASRGDLILTFAGGLNITSPSGPYLAEFRTAEVIIQCPQVAYGTLLESVSSDVFMINGIRYTIADPTKIAQFNNKIGVIEQSLFGKTSDDSINPNSQKLPSQFQTNIIDVPLEWKIIKSRTLATYMNYDCDNFIFSLFIPVIEKLK